MKRAFRYDRLMILGPTPKDWIHPPEKFSLRLWQMTTNDFLDLVVKRLRVFPAWFDEQGSPILAEIPSQEVEAVINVHDFRLFR